MTTKRTELVGAKPEDPPGWRLLFLMVQGQDGQWWRGFVLVALTGLLLVGLVVLLIFAGWPGGLVGAGGLATLVASQRRRRSRGRQRGCGAAADALAFEADSA